MTVAGGRPGGPPASAPPAVRAVLPLVVRGLTVDFGRIRALDGVDLDVSRGAIVGLVGPNGCGKTTTLRAVLGLVAASAGSIEVDGAPGGTRAARARVSWIPDEPSGLDELSVDEVVKLVGALWAAGDSFAVRGAVLLEAFGLDRSRALQVGSLSHGRRRIVSIVAAVALDRSLLLVDEATAALDPEATIVLREVLGAAARRGRGVLVATQDLHFAESICDRVTLLSGGRVAAEGSLDALRERFGARTLEDVFLRATGADDRVRELRRALDAL